MNNQAGDTVPAVPAVPSEAWAEARQLTRAEAAEYLTSKGYKISIATLAKHASASSGPPFNKVGTKRNAIYRQSDLDAWATKNKQSNELSTAVAELLPLIDRAMHGQGTFADGMHFAETVEAVRKALARRRRANGTE